MMKNFKRAIAFLVMASLLAALMVPGVFAQEPATASTGAPATVIYNFMVKDRTDLTYDNGKTLGGTTIGGIAATTLVIDTAYAASADAYDVGAGKLNWSFPHTLGDDGKPATTETYKNYSTTEFRFGVGAGSSDKNYNYDGIQLISRNEAGWGALVLKAPNAGTYNVTMQYTSVSLADTAQSLFLVPYTAELKAQMASDPDTFNAYLDGIRNGTAYKLGAVSYRAEPFGQKQVTFENIVIDGTVSEYLFMITGRNGYDDYVEALVMTPAAAETKTYNIAVDTGNPPAADGMYNKYYNSGSEQAIASIKAAYEAGTIDWMVASYTVHNKSNAKNGLEMMVYDSLYNAASPADSKWLALKLKAPATGAYNISVDFTYNTAVGVDMQAFFFNADLLSDEADTAEYAALMTETNSIGIHRNTAGNTVGQFGAGSFVAGEEYILILQAAGYTEGVHTSNLRAYITGVTLNPITAAAATIGNVEYATVGEAIDAADNGDTVKMYQDYTALTVDLKPGVTLDINGHNVITSSVTSLGGFVIDSLGGGAVKTAVLSLHGNNGLYMPMFDAAKGGYCFYQYHLSIDEANVRDQASGATRFWFYLSFADKAVYDKIIAGGTDVTIGVDLVCEDDVLDATFDNGDGSEAFASEWAAAAKNNANIWLYVDIKGMEVLAGSDLEVIPAIDVAAGNELNNGSVIYPVPAE